MFSLNNIFKLFIILKLSVVNIYKYINYIILIQVPIRFSFRFSVWFQFLGSRDIKSTSIIDRIQTITKTHFLVRFDLVSHKCAND